jgi:hypothetical protein
MEEQRDWHRLFGMSWTDFFAGLPVVVEMEKDLSQKQQLLDVAIIRTNDEPIPYRLPDGFEDLGRHNLITFKSHHDTLGGETLNELVSYYVNYRKQVSPSMNDLLPETDFHLFAVSVRFPQGMSGQVPLRRIQEGVYEANHFTGMIRLVVVHQLPLEEQNAMLHLFAAGEEMIRYGGAHYRPRSLETSRFLLQLCDRHREEGMPMPYTKEEFIREANERIAKDADMIEMVLKDLSPEKRLEGVSPEKRLEGISPEKRLEGISPEKRLEGISPEKRLEGLSPEDILQGMSPKVLEEFLRQSKAKE